MINLFTDFDNFHIGQELYLVPEFNNPPEVVTVTKMGKTLWLSNGARCKPALGRIFIFSKIHNGSRCYLSKQQYEEEKAFCAAWNELRKTISKMNEECPWTMPKNMTLHKVHQIFELLEIEPTVVKTADSTN